RHPLRQVFVLVVVAEAEVRGRPFDVPRLVVAAVKPHPRQVAGRDLELGRHARAVTLRDVDGHVRDVASAKKGERAVSVAGVHPLWLAKLHRDLESEHALLALLDVRERARGWEEPRRKLKE